MKNDTSRLIRQGQPGEDGLACVAMIFLAHEVAEDLITLRGKYPHHSIGMSLKSMIDIFSHHKLITKPLHCSIEEIENLKLPCILHWDMKQFVVLSKIEKNVFTVLNPSNKKTRYMRDEFETHFCEIVLEIKPKYD
ncbi:MAG: cysteine peptidase family C39 domain-containing protein [Pseudomonadota bacterium]